MVWRGQNSRFHTIVQELVKWGGGAHFRKRSKVANSSCLILPQQRGASKHKFMLDYSKGSWTFMMDVCDGNGQVLQGFFGSPNKLVSKEFWCFSREKTTENCSQHLELLSYTQPKFKFQTFFNIHSYFILDIRCQNLLTCFTCSTTQQISKVGTTKKKSAIELTI